MVAWVDRDTYMERLWALEGTRGIKVITGARRFVNVNPSFTDSTSGRARAHPQLEADGVGEAVVPKNLREQLARGTVAAHDAFED